MSGTVAISVLSDAGLAAELDPRFGRAPYFLIAETDGQTWTAREVVHNTAGSDPQGAGGKAAAMLSKVGVDAVISGRFGPKAYLALKTLNIPMWLANRSLTAKAALEAYDHGRLKMMKVTVY